MTFNTCGAENAQDHLLQRENIVDQFEDGNGIVGAWNWEACKPEALLTTMCCTVLMQACDLFFDLICESLPPTFAILESVSFTHIEASSKLFVQITESALSKKRPQALATD